MEPVIEFKAPWSAGLKRISTILLVALAILTVAGVVAWRQTGAPAALLAVLMPPIVVLACVLCIVKGYVLSGEEIVVKRLAWSTRLPLDDLRSVAGDNEAMNASLRLFGNGGLLSYTGYFWNRKLGRYRAFATDPSRAVVLSYPRRKIVITPDDPQRFIVRARTILKNRGR
jgi:hypothetical protein